MLGRIARWVAKPAVVTLLALALGLLVRPANVLAQQATRLRAVLVLDASGSMAANDPQRLVRVAAKMLSDLADERDHITIVSFGAQTKILASARGNEHDKLRAAIETLSRTEACTDYGQAFEAAAAAFTGKPPPGERRVVLFLTDGKYEPAKANAGCDDYERGTDGDRQSFTHRVDQAADKLKQSGARVFTIGLGNAPTRSEHSAALLRSVADKTGGKFLHAQNARDVPRIFAGIFGALIGAPVMQDRLDQGRTTATFTVPKGASRLHVILVPDNPRDLESCQLTRQGKGGGKVPFEPARVETPRSGYQLARVEKDAAGACTLSGTPAGPVEVLVVPDVGLALRLEGIPKVLPEKDSLKGVLALRTREGDTVKLAPEYLRDVVFTVSMGGKALFDQQPDANGEAKFSSPGALARGEYKITASARHQQGLLDVEPVEATFKVMPQFELQLGPAEIRFDTMAEEGPIPVKPKSPIPIAVTAPAQLPADITVDLRLPGGRANEDLKLKPREITFGPGKPRQVTVELSFVKPEDLRGDDVHYRGDVAIVVSRPEHQRLLTGKREWRVPLDGKLRSWTLGRYLEEYKWEIGIGLGILLILIWIIGRVLAHKFPLKARIHYQAVGEQFETDSLIKRRAKHGAYRSARFGFPLGKKAKKLVYFRAKGTRFEVLPEGHTTVTILDDTIDEAEREKRKPFDGRWQQRYRLGDRYEVWLTRT